MTGSQISIELENAIFDNLTLTTKISDFKNTIIPTEWDDYMFFDAKFNGTMIADNIEDYLKTIDEIKIERRNVGETEWMLLFDKRINSPSDLSFSFRDNLTANGTEYEYRLIPMKNNQPLNTIIKRATARFNSIFLCDSDIILNFFTKTTLDIETMQEIESYQPINNRYPIFISNAETDYKQGSLVNDVLLPITYLDSHQIDRNGIVKYANMVDSFIKNKKAKILKDMNGNMFLIMIKGNPKLTYDGNYGNGIVRLSFDWIECGDVNNQIDLYNNKLIKALY